MQINMKQGSFVCCCRNRLVIITCTVVMLLLVALTSCVVDARGFGGRSGFGRIAKGLESKYTPKDTKKKTASIKPTFIAKDVSSDEGVDHVVLLKINSIKATKIQLRKLEKGAYSLSSIDGVESVTFGQVYMDQAWMDKKQMSGYNAGYNYYLRVRLASVDHLKFYHNHPYHKKIQEDCIDPISTGPSVCVDCTAAVMLPSKSSAAIIREENTALPQKQQQPQLFNVQRSKVTQ